MYRGDLFGLGLLWIMGTMMVVLVGMLLCSDREWYRKTNTHSTILGYHDEYFVLIGLGLSWFGLIVVIRHIKYMDGQPSRIARSKLVLGRS